VFLSHSCAQKLLIVIYILSRSADLSCRLTQPLHYGAQLIAVHIRICYCHYTLVSTAQSMVCQEQVIIWEDCRHIARLVQMPLQWVACLSISDVHVAYQVLFDLPDQIMTTLYVPNTVFKMMFYTSQKRDIFYCLQMLVSNVINFE